jgi:hypothetical protein
MYLQMEALLLSVWDMILMIRYGEINKKKGHEKITHRLSFHNESWLETVILARARQPAMCLQPQEAPGFVAAPSVATHNTITKHNESEILSGTN